MNQQRLRAVARELGQPRILLRLAKTSAVLAVEIATAPAWALAARSLRKGPRSERLLAAQNRFRRAALWWIFPEFRQRD